MSVEEDFRRERAKRAAAVRWEKARIEKRLWAIADGYIAVNPKLTRAQAFANATAAHPEIYQEYVTASDRMPNITAGEMEDAYQAEIRDICALGNHPEMADQFIRQRMEQRDVIAYLLERRKTETR